MKKCPFCAEEIQDEAIVCKHCGRDLAQKQQIATSSPAKPQAKKLSNPTLIGILAILGVCLFIYAMITLKGGSGAKGTPTPANNKTQAFYVCQMFVEKQLKAPKSADFASVRDSTVETVIEGQQFRISSYVDAQNSFGAMIRTNYTCTVDWRDGNWYLADLQTE